MRKPYLTISLLTLTLTLILGGSSVLAHDIGTDHGHTMLGTSANASTTVKARSLPVETRMKASTTLELQRTKLLKEAEARKKAAEVRGDVMQVKRETMKLEIEAKWQEQDTKREALRLEFEAKRASSTVKRVEWQQDVAKRKAEHTIKIMTATIERLEKIISRIEARIAKIKAAGGATAESEGFITFAKADLVLAETSVSTLTTIDLSSDKAKENFERIRTVAAEAREHIRSTHHNMMLAVRALRALEVDVNATATSTTTVQ